MRDSEFIIKKLLEDGVHGASAYISRVAAYTLIDKNRRIAELEAIVKLFAKIEKDTENRDGYMVYAFDDDWSRAARAALGEKSEDREG